MTMGRRRGWSREGRWRGGGGGDMSEIGKEEGIELRVTLERRRGWSRE